MNVTCGPAQFRSSKVRFFFEVEYQIKTDSREYEHRRRTRVQGHEHRRRTAEGEESAKYLKTSLDK
jgi:hypothetical protein